MSSTSIHHRKPPPPPQLLLVFLVHVFLGIQLSYSLTTYSSNQTSLPLPVRCRPDQASALLRLKSSFSTDGWGPFLRRWVVCTALASWRAGTDCCDWEGIRCGDGDGRVTTLDLGFCGLESSGLHPALFDLTSLRHLDLSWNSFNGSQLPASGFERLTSLVHLNLSNCGFGGQIPHAIRQLTKLVTLDLSTEMDVYDEYDDFSSLTFWTPDWWLVEPNIASLVANLSNLKQLYLGYVDLSSNGPLWCNTFVNSTPQLEILSLPVCYLYGSICKSLSSITPLTEVNLQYNNGLQGPIPESFADLPSLSVLKLTKNQLEGWFPSRIFQNKNLTAVDIRYNFDLSGSLPNFSSDNIFTELRVSSTNFSGTIPSSIGNLKSLNKLGVATVDSSHELPSSIGELRSLTSLEVSGAGVVGGIPSWVANLTSLVWLQFSDCGMSGEIPAWIGNLKNLIRLQLYNCNFSGRLPPQIFNLTQLEYLYLHSNNFHGIVELSSFWNLPELSSLSLSNNKLTVAVDDEGNSSAVIEMDALKLSACNISKIPSALRYMHHVDYLDLSDNQIHGDIPHWAWEKWGQMLVLNLSHNKFSIIENSGINMVDTSLIDLSFNLLEGPIPLPGPNTQLLDCSNNRFSSMPLNFGSQAGSILYLKANENTLSGKIPQTICEAKNLILIDLSNNSLSGPIPSCLMEGTVTVLNLKINQLHGELPNNVNQSCAFKQFDISDNQIEGKLPRSLVACRDLQIFNIGNNHINDTFPCWMSMLAKLQVLVLKSNKFIGKVRCSALGGKDSCEFTKLQILDLASNKFSGTLQDGWFTTMKSMATKSINESMELVSELVQTGTYQFTAAITYKGKEVVLSTILETLVQIDVSDNEFHGAIPKSIGDLGLLNGVNMSHNAFSGPIPPQFGALNQLESLDLSSNNLSGEIPQGLASLNFLSLLNLSYNELVGRIPNSPHFMTFTNLSFLGNIGLCGFQVSRTCNSTTPYVEPHHSEKESVDLVLFLFAGLGFGVGFAVAIVLTCGINVRRSQSHIFLCWKKVLFFV